MCIFADDMKCFKVVKSVVDEQNFQKDLSLLSFWSASNHLSVYPKVFEVGFLIQVAISQCTSRYNESRIGKEQNTVLQSKGWEGGGGQ